MSYESMARAEIGCDFPECTNNFDDSEVMRVATIRNGEIVAFCRGHSAYLIGEGVHLHLLREVQQEWNARRGRVVKENEREARERREREFIASLK